MCARQCGSIVIRQLAGTRVAARHLSVTLEGRSFISDNEERSSPCSYPLIFLLFAGFLAMTPSPSAIGLAAAAGWPTFSGSRRRGSLGGSVLNRKRNEGLLGIIRKPIVPAALPRTRWSVWHSWRSSGRSPSARRSRRAVDRPAAVAHEVAGRVGPRGRSDRRVPAGPSRGVRDGPHLPRPADARRRLAGLGPRAPRRSLESRRHPRPGVTSTVPRLRAFGSCLWRRCWWREGWRGDDREACGRCGERRSCGLAADSGGCCGGCPS